MVGLYFNTKNMSAILKALQNRKSVELKSEKVEFAGIKDFEKLKTKSLTLLKRLRESEDLGVKLNSEIEEMQKKIEGSKADMKATTELAMRTAKEISNTIDVVSNQAKELGVKPDQVKGLSYLEGLGEDVYKKGLTLSKFKFKLK